METVGQILTQAIKNLQAGNFTEAQSLCDKILQHHPEQIDTLFLCGVIAYQQKKVDEAIVYYQKILTINPNLAEVHSNMAAAQIDKGCLDVALFHSHEALKIKPNYAEAYQNLANALRLQGKQLEAIAAYQKAIELQPSCAESHNGIGVVYKQQGVLDLAVSHFQKAIALTPNQAYIHNNLANALSRQGKYTQAISHYQQAIKLNPNYPDACSNLGGLFMRQGYIETAIKYKQLALSQNPSCNAYHSNLLLALNYLENPDLEANFAVAKQWAIQQASAYIPTNKHYTNNPNPKRPLKIGYLSPDFRTHSVAYFIKPIIQAHNPEKVEVFCYANVTTADETTLEFQKLAHQWRNIVGYPDEKVAEKIQQDEIDILVDLAGHTSDNRMLVFACKPAPIQVTYLGYPASTGLPTIDYRITDNYADPIGLTEKFHTEKLIRLPSSFLCYQTAADIPEVAPPPVLHNGYITFGCFNNLAKISLSVLKSWAKILQAVPESRLLLKYRGLGDLGTQERFLNTLQTEGIPSERLILIDRISSHQQHLATYNQVDIALDTFPYNGTTTTCEALSMGVPVIVKAGINHVSRVGVSILANVGLPELIGDSQESYINIAVELANNIQLLQDMRATQREKMRRSPLMQSESFTSAIEDIYIKIWQNFCNS